MRKYFLKLVTLRELFQFLWAERMWWMIPFVATLIIIGLLLVFAQTSPIAPFLYTVF